MIAYAVGITTFGLMALKWFSKASELNDKSHRDDQKIKFLENSMRIQKAYIHGSHPSCESCWQSQSHLEDFEKEYKKLKMELFTKTWEIK